MNECNRCHAIIIIVYSTSLLLGTADRAERAVKLMHASALVTLSSKITNMKDAYELYQVVRLLDVETEIMWTSQIFPI